MTRTSGGPLPTIRYPTRPAVVWASCTGADTTEDAEAGLLGVAGEEPQAATATDSSAVTSARAIPPSVAWPLVRVISACLQILAAAVMVTEPASRATDAREMPARREVHAARA